jgi:hypothetical protein
MFQSLEHILIFRPPKNTFSEDRKSGPRKSGPVKFCLSLTYG